MKQNADFFPLGGAGVKQNVIMCYVFYEAISILKENVFSAKVGVLTKILGIIR